MALEISGYTLPGVYQGEVVAADGGTVSATGSQIGIIGYGERTKRIKNEQVYRGIVKDETVTFIASTGTGDSLSAPTGAPAADTDPPAGLQTLTDAAATFVTDGVRPGARITISGAASGNNGTFRIREVVSETVLILTNPNGQSETSSFTWRVVPHAVLANRALRGTQYLSLYKNGTLIPDSRVSFLPAVVRGSATATVNLTTPKAFSLEMDGRRAITVALYDAVSGTGDSFAVSGTTVTLTDAAATFLTSGVKPGMVIDVAGAADNLHDGEHTITDVTQTTVTWVDSSAGAAGADATVTYEITGVGVIGRQVNSMYAFAVPAAATIDEISAAIALGLAGFSELGSAYRYAVEETATGIQITSQTALTGPSDVRVFAGFASDAVTALFGASAADTRDARTFVELDRLSYTAGATYTVDYISVDDTSDELANTPTDVLQVGSKPNLSDYEEDVSWAESSDEVAWDIATQATFTGSDEPGSGPVPVDTTADTLKLSVNQQSTVEMDLYIASPGNSDTPLGFVFGAATAANTATCINAWLVNQYGPRYGSVAAAVASGTGTALRLSAPASWNTAGVMAPVGADSAIQVFAASGADAATALFGAATGKWFGTGRVPAPGTSYYATYKMDRPASEYNVQRRFFTVDRARAALGFASESNPLMQHVEIAFSQYGTGTGSVVVVQVDDATSAGDPTRAEWKAALDATLKTDVVTEVRVLSTELEEMVDLRDHLENANAPTVKRYRRGWFGLPRSTEPGDRDTPDTFVYFARRTLQVAADSPARGRMMLVAPPQLTGVSRDFTDEDGNTVTIELDSGALATALAARRARTADFPNQAASLAKKALSGFNIDDITEDQVWTSDEHAVMASQGVMVVSYDAGLLYVLDPVTTEVGGSQLNVFKYESSSPQKDRVVRSVDQALAPLSGVVPSSIEDFIALVKTTIAGALEAAIAGGDIGPFTTASGASRPIDLSADIIAARNANDPSKIDFNYWFNLKYPALRFFGQYSADAPFFGST